MTMQLIIGNKKYSSWSLRPWLAMKVKGIEFEEVLSQFDVPNESQHFYSFSPSKKVPVLQHDELTVWDSMAILEYLAELTPQNNWWPQERIQRAKARAIAHEMHGGFGAIREQCPMNFGREPSPIDLSERCKWEYNRLEVLWDTALQDSGGPFLFGEFTIADAMYAPMVSRIRSYSVEGGSVMETYCNTIEGVPEYQDWARDGIAESWIVEEVET